MFTLTKTFILKTIPVIFLIALPILITASNGYQQIFYSLTNEDGLSQGSILCICQDNMGFIWIGTNDGLNRYDGYNVKIYRNIPGDTTSLSSNRISSLFADNNGYVWIGTAGGGLNKYDPAVNKFTRYYFKTPSKELFGSIINSIAKDTNGNIWIGTNNDGLIKLDPETGEYKRFTHDPDNLESISNNTITVVYVDKKGNIWIGTKEEGLNLFIPETQKFKIYKHNPQNSSSISGNSISAIIEGNDGVLWIGTMYSYLNYFDPEKEVFIKHHENIPQSIFSLKLTGQDSLWVSTGFRGLFLYNISKRSIKRFYSGTNKGMLSYNTILSLFKDRDGNLWIGTSGKGVNIYSPNKKKIITYELGTALSSGLSFSSVRAIYEDDNKTLWVGGYKSVGKYGGFDKIDLKTNNISMLNPEGEIYCIFPDRNNKNILWLGTEGQGIIRFNTKTLNFRNYFNKPPFTSDSIIGNSVYFIKNDKVGNFYIGTNSGLNVISVDNRKCKFYKHNPNNSFSLMNGFIMAFFIDPDNNIWLGSDIGGLAKFDRENDIFIRYTNSLSDTNSISSNNVFSIYEDSKGRFWISTDNGLNLMDRKKGSFSKITVTDGLPNNVVYASLEDNEGNLWLSTNLGLCKYNPDKNIFSTFDKNDGLPGNEFNRVAYFKNNDGELYFGGVNGLVCFDPSRITKNPILPKVLITNYYKENIEVESGSGISSRHELILQPEDKIISFEFSAMTIVSQEKCEYAYKLENFMEDWIEIGNRRRISFTNLDPGEYTLLIKATNNDGIWNENPTKLNITVLPYFYETILFKISMAFLIISSVLIIYFMRISLIRKQEKKLIVLVEQRTFELEELNKHLSVEVEERKKTEILLRKVNASKDKLYSIIAHDLKSPFNTLIGFSDLLVEEWNTFTDDKRFEMIKMMQSTSNSTFDLLVNLLEWSRYQIGNYKFEPIRFDFNKLAIETYSQLKGQASLKNITINMNIGKETFLFADYNMTSTIFRNIFSNAIKYSFRNGKINITANERDGIFSCCIHDNGIGINNKNYKNIFKTDSNFSSKGTDGEAGTGLGLVLCKEFIEKNKGKLSVETEENKGSKFCFTLPSFSI
jgi:ligand-binding sensor domain-containing protein/signal transduction histidine kinase